MGEHLRIDELAEQAAAAVVASGAVPPSARVSAVPDRRMLRYYTTLGLLDRPVEVRGRTAYYGRRHLLQVVAIKRLQAEGASLAEVQRRLLGVSTAELERIAGPLDVLVRPDHRNGGLALQEREGSVPAAVRLAPGVTLVFDAGRPLTDDDHAAVQAAGAKVVEHLSARGLLPPKEPQ
ncbi:MAG: MerR family transcriptional regulator [Acidimicrobiales bacterium]